MSRHRSRRWIGLGEAAPHPPGAVYREGDVEKGGSWRGRFLWVPPECGRAESCNSGVLSWKGLGRQHNARPAPRPPSNDTLTAVGKNSRVASLQRGETVLRGAGQDAIESRTGQAGSLARGGGSGEGLGSKAGSLASWLCDLGRVTSVL